MAEAIAPPTSGPVHGSHSTWRTAPLWAGVGVCVAIAAVMIAGAQRTDGRLVYTLDDAYIHMSIARNLANGHGWGVNPGEFAGASSSPLWTVLVAGCFRLFGPRGAVPLVLNLLAMVGAIAGLWCLLARFVRDRRLLALACFAIAMALPLPMLVISGMEHTLQIALVFGFVLFWLDALDGRACARRLAGGTALAALLVATRYEGLFLIFPACVLLLLRGRWRPAVLWGACAWVPVGLYAAYSLRHGGAAFPNSVLLKGSAPGNLSIMGVLAFVADGLRRVLVAGPLAELFLAGAAILAWLWRNRDSQARGPRYLLGLFLLTALLHGQFAAVGWFSRYEAYLIGLGAVAVCAVVASAWRDERPNRVSAWVVTAAACIAAVPLAGRAVVTLYRDCLAPGNIYQQQCQMAFFVRDHYAGKAVAVNDIGAVSWYGSAHVVDLWGLADREVFRARREGRYTPAVMRHACDEAGEPVAIVYPGWFAGFGGLPREWKRVGDWTIPHNVAAADATVVVYSTDPADASRVARAFAEFSRTLPPGVRGKVGEER
jgi:hypothetical protein